MRLSAWTASFRYAGFMIGLQPTLPMPPLSTIYGLVSAAAGRVITPKDTFVGYTFRSRGQSEDLEKIVEIEPGVGGKWNVIRRQILCDAHLELYLEPQMGESFRRPYYPLLLGRSSDLASVDSIDEVDLDKVGVEKRSTFGESIYSVPPPSGYRLATMYSLPVFFTESIPREARGTRPFMMITERYQSNGEGYRDTDSGLTFEIFTDESLFG